MDNKNSVTPSLSNNEATPDKKASVNPNPPAENQSAVNKQAGLQEGQVVISTKEFAQLQRDRARLLAFEKRKELYFKKNNPSKSQELDNLDGVDEVIKEEIVKAKSKASELEKELFKERLINKTRDILTKPEYSILPESTRNLILKNPALLTNSEDVEEAILDVEDFIREESAKIIPPSTELIKHETPPKINSGAPTTNLSPEEDFNKLSGPDRSRAILRKKFRDLLKGNNY